MHEVKADQQQGPKAMDRIFKDDLYSYEVRCRAKASSVNNSRAVSSNLFSWDSNAHIKITNLNLQISYPRFPPFL